MLTQNIQFLSLSFIRNKNSFINSKQQKIKLMCVSNVFLELSRRIFYSRKFNQIKNSQIINHKTIISQLKKVQQYYILRLNLYIQFFYKYQFLMQQIDSLLKDIPLGCKILYVLSFVVFVIGLFVTNFTILLANVSYFTYANNQYWRLFSSVLSPGVSLFSIISLIVDFCLIRFFFAKIEKKYSSIYFLTQIILQNLIIQILFTFVSVILIQIGIISIVSLLGFGWAPLLIIFSFKNVHETQQETLKVLCFQVPKKHLSLVVILISFILGYSQFLCLLVAVGLGYLQFVVLKRHLIKLPISYYKFWDKIIPKFITSRQDYIQVQFVQSVLQVECSTFSIQKKKRFFNFSKNKKTQTKTTQNQSKKSYGENHKSLNEQILENTDNIYAGDKEQNDRSTIDSKKIDCDQIFL